MIQTKYTYIMVFVGGPQLHLKEAITLSTL